MTSGGTRHVGTLQLGNLPNIWHALDLLDEQMEKINNRTTTEMDFTDRRFDEATRTGQRMYIHAYSFIKVARDNQKGLEELLGVAARPYAPWNLIRPAFESSFYVVWMLEPQDKRTRLQRALRIAWEEQRQHRNRFELMVDLAKAHSHEDVLSAEAKDRDIKHRFEEEAREVALSRAGLGRSPKLTEELPKLVTLANLNPDQPKFQLLKWRELSGIQHGDMGAFARLSDKQYGLKIPGGHVVEVSLNDDNFVAACYSSALMQLHALQLYNQRSSKVTKIEVKDSEKEQRKMNSTKS